MSKEMEINRVSSEAIVTMVEKAFENQIASINNIQAFEVKCDDRIIDGPVRIEIDISGHAGTPTVDDFKEGRVEGSESMTIERDDIGEMKFDLVPSQTCFLSGNDYCIVYESN